LDPFRKGVFWASLCPLAPGMALYFERQHPKSIAYLEGNLIIGQE
jgi:hypothetical protein